jgi:hypothetical protein
MNEQFIMRPGDTFVAPECGCAFTVTAGPRDESMSAQAPRCCCGHEMKKTEPGVQQDSGSDGPNSDASLGKWRIS